MPRRNRKRTNNNRRSKLLFSENFHSGLLPATTNNYVIPGDLPPNRPFRPLYVRVQIVANQDSAATIRLYNLSSSSASSPGTIKSTGSFVVGTQTKTVFLRWPRLDLTLTIPKANLCFGISHQCTRGANTTPPSHLTVAGVYVFELGPEIESSSCPNSGISVPIQECFTESLVQSIDDLQII